MPPTRLSEEQIRHIDPLVVTYLEKHPSISNTDLRALAAIRYDQATYFFQIPPDLVVKLRIPVIPATQSGAKLPPNPKEACHPIRTKAAPHRSPIGAQRRLG